MSKTRPYPHPSPRERRAFLPTTNAHDACLPPAQVDTSYRSSVDENDVYLLSGGAENTGSVSPRTEDTRVLSYRAQKVCPLSPAERRSEGEGAPRISAGVIIAAKIAFVFFCVAPVMAQPYPSKPVRILTSTPGNSDDLAARLIAQGITGGLGQQTVVDNRGVVAVEIAAKSPPDGYTLLLYGSPMWLAPFMRDKLPYDPVKDFAPVTWATNSPNLLVVHPALPVKSVRELVTLAKARPNELNYGSGSAGSTPHLAAELLRAMTGVQIVRVAYKGSGPALTALLSGELHFMFPSTGSAYPLLKSGKIRPLAVTTLKPTALAPGLPTLAESGLPGYESASLLAVFAPAGTPAAILQKLNQEMVKVLQSAEARERLFNSGVEAVGSTPEQFAMTLKNEMVKWGKVIKDAGIRSE